MADQTEKVPRPPETDPFQCEYVPFGGQDKIKLSFNFILRWLVTKTAKGAIAGEQDVMKFLMTCKAKRLNPFDGDAFLVGYDGKDGPVFSTIVAHQAFLKRAETHPEFDGMESGVIVQHGDTIKELVGDFYPAGTNVVGGWATVFFVNRRHPMTKRLKLSTFDKGRSLWRTNPEGMIVKCAEADALRSSFPQLIGGMYLREEIVAGDVQAAPRDPIVLPDRRNESTPYPYGSGPAERSYVDKDGNRITGRVPERYEQDAAAAEVQDRIRYTTTEAAKGPPVSSFTPEDTVAATEDGEPGVFDQLLERCEGVCSLDHANRVNNEIGETLNQGIISKEQARRLTNVVIDRMESGGGYTSS
jgi:phage recombination protein Bet